MSSIVTRTLLLTDIVGSTSIVEALGDEPAADLLAEVDRVVRDAVASTGGVEIDKTDGFLILFERALDAVRCGLRIHDALAELSGGRRRPLAMRCGIHVGEVVLRENSPDDVAHGAKPIEVDGLAKPMAARIMSLARGGQTLLTRSAYELAERAVVGDTELAGLRFSDHGAYRLAGVSEPVEVFEVGRRRPKRPGTSDKVRPVVRGSRWPRRLALLGLMAAAVAAAWVLWPQFAGYTTLSAPARVSLHPALQARFEAAWEAYRAGDIAAARQGLDALAVDLPTQADVRLSQLAMALADRNRIPPELMEDVTRQLDGQFGPDVELLGFLERWKVEGWDPQKLHDEIDAFRARFPDHLVGLLLSIDLHHQQQRADELPELVETLMASTLGMASAYSMRADAQIRTDDFDAATATLSDGLTRFPDHPTLTHRLAVLQWEQGHADVAHELLEGLLERVPGHLAAHASTVSTLLALDRESDVPPHLSVLDDVAAAPPERVAHIAAVAEGFAVEGRFSRARELLEQAFAEAEAAQLSEAWVDVARTELRWACNADVTTAAQRTIAIERAEQALLEPWMSDAERRRLIENVSSARAVEAWMNGDTEAAREIVESLPEGGANDALGAGFLVRTADAAQADVPPEWDCKTARAAGEVWFHSGEPVLAAAALDVARDAACEGRTHELPQRAAAEAHLAHLALDAGEITDAVEHTQTFRSLWSRADPDLPVFRSIERTEQRLAAHAATGVERKKKKRGKRRRGR